MSVRPTSSRLNNVLCVVCGVLLALCAVEAIYKIASIPLFYQRAVSGTLPEPLIAEFTQASNTGVAQEAALRGMTTSDYVIYRVARDGLYTLVFYLVAFLILRRAGGQWFLWFTALILFFVPAGQLSYYSPIDYDFTRYLELLGILWPAFPLFLYLFPNGRAVPGWLSWLIGPVLVAHLIGQGIAAMTMVTGRPNDLITALTPYLGFLLLSFPLALLGQVVRYLRVSTFEERLQTKWVLGGLVGVVVSGVIIPALYNMADPQADYGFSSDVINMLTLLIPVTIGISILRYRLYDIDIIIRRTMVYGSLTAVLGLAYFGGVTVLQNVFTALSGQSSALALVISTLAIAALFNPVRRRIQEGIDRRFYRQKYDAEKLLASFAQSTRNATEVDRLSDELTEAVCRAIQPEHASLWYVKLGMRNQ